MREQLLDERLRRIDVPGEDDAEVRALQVVRHAYARREPLARRSRRHPLLAAAAAGIFVLALLTPAGADIRDWVDDVIRSGSQPASSALTSLPAPGRILVESERGSWVLNEDGSQRLLGAYDEASWSPSGLYVVAARGRRLVALEPDGDLRWSVTRAGRAGAPEWLHPSGFRIAYLSGSSLRVVAGDGTGDAVVSASVAPVAPAWRPGQRPVLAFADRRGALTWIDTDSRRVLFRFPRLRPVAIDWSTDATRFLVVQRTGTALVIDGHTGAPLGRRRGGPQGRIATAALAPGNQRLAYVRAASAAGSTRSELVLASAIGSPSRDRVLFSGYGAFTDLVWSPDGRWLLLAWKEADQWLFIDTRRPSRVVAVGDISRQFDPGGERPAEFPRVSGWCCAG